MRITNRGVMPHVHLLSDIPALVQVQYLVCPNGSANGAFSSIQAAIDQAQADGHEDNADPAVVVICAGRYTEDVQLRRGIYLCGCPSAPNTIIIQGTVTCDLSVGTPGPPVLNAFTAMIGCSVLPPGSQDAVVFSGSNSQLLFLSECGLFTFGGGRAVFMDNSGADSQVVSESYAAIGGAANPTIEVLDGQLLAADVVWQNDSGAPSVHVGSGAQIVVNEVLTGAGNIVIDAGGGILLTEGVLNTGNVVNEGTFQVRNLSMFGTALAPAVQGASPAELLGTISFIGGATGFSVSPTRYPADEPAVAYVDSTPPGTWAGVPTSLMEAVNRLAVAVSTGFPGGPIP